MSLVQQKTGTSSAAGTCAATLDAAPTVGNALILIAANDNDTVSSIAGGGVTWAKAVSSGVRVVSEIWYGLNVAGAPPGSTITVTWSGSTGHGAINVSEHSGILTAGATDGAGTPVNGSSATPATPAMTPGNATDLIIGTVGSQMTGAAGAATNSFTDLTGVAIPASSGQLLGAYRYVSSIASYSTGWTITGTGDGYDGNIAAFKLAASCAVTGTATAGIAETDVVAGGKTVILTLTGDTYVADSISSPLIEAADCTVSGNNTAQATWAVSHPAANIGDLLIFLLAWDDSTTTTDVTEPAGPNGETLSEINATPVTDGNTETRSKGWYCIATGSWAASTVTFTPSATESWSATVIRVPAGEFDAATPIGAVGTRTTSGLADTAALSPAFTAGGSDGTGRLVWFAGVDADPLTGTITGWTVQQTQDLGAVTHGVATRDTAVSNSESIAGGDTWTIASDSWTSIAFVVRAPTVSPFAAARAAIASGLDSAQSEAAGWDAKVKPNIPVGNVVRTSGTVCTITLQAQGDYNITATETITATVPAAALSAGSPIVGSPTFTVTASAGDTLQAQACL